MDRALPGRYIDLIRDGVSSAQLKRSGRQAIWSALVSTAMSAQMRGWDEVEWTYLVLDPKSYLGYQARSKGKDRTLPATQAAKQMRNAWEKAWVLRTERESGDPAWGAERAAQEATARAEAATTAIENQDVDLTDAERAVLAYAVSQTRLRQFTNVAMPRRAIYTATGLGSTAVSTALNGLATKGLLHLHQAGQNAATTKYRRASIYTLADVRCMASYVRDLTGPPAAAPSDVLASVTPIRRLSDGLVQGHSTGPVHFERAASMHPRQQLAAGP